MSTKFFSIFLMVILLLSGCASQHKNTTIIPQPALDREAALSSVSNWKIKGKIAFISPKERQSANLYWLKRDAQQQLNLTSILGTNVFSIDSTGDFHTLTLDGKNYQGTNLDQLILELTGLKLPVDALGHWIKAIHHTSADQISYDPSSQLPRQLTTLHNGELWRIDYSNYRQIDHVALPLNIAIVQNELIIKLKINQWDMM